MISQVLKIAFGELGQKEVVGPNHNPRILEYQDATGLVFGNDETPWCSIFANWVALQANLPRSHSPMARSWLDVGESTSWPQPGDIVVFWRRKKSSPYGHVGFFLGFTKSLKSVYVLGGNQTDAVTVDTYKVSKILGYRSLEFRATTEVPNGYLRRGESNENVKKLQLLLIRLGYLNGSADGVFGPMTERALKDFQTDKNIQVDGVYGNQSREKLLEAIR